ncbi:hypothetical protein GPALN_009787 [Globodera pallida]|nr:hypothetical protein GPALN_009787 [Globodera pallida]
MLNFAKILVKFLSKNPKNLPDGTCRHRRALLPRKIQDDNDVEDEGQSTFIKIKNWEKFLSGYPRIGYPVLPVDVLENFSIFSSLLAFSLFPWKKANNARERSGVFQCPVVCSPD